MSILNEEIVRSIIATTGVPIVFRGYIRNWALCQWSIEKWTETFGERELQFRCMKKDFLSDEPCWERKCIKKKLTFDKFVKISASGNEWMYFDYKYLHEVFSCEDEFYKAISWKLFGYADKGAADTTLWVGSAAAHTPAHQDTYGVNIVAQVYGTKRWILFPPESGGMKPTRVPYEESSVYSELNFYCPISSQGYCDLTGGRVVDLAIGDALVVPHGWWHYVQNEDDINISLNMWLPHENDKNTRLAEAAIKLFVAQICKDLPEATIKLVVNPNEDDLPDTPLAVLLLQLEAAVKQTIDKKRKDQRTKRQRTSVDELPSTDTGCANYDLKALLDNPKNNMSLAPLTTGMELVELIEETKKRFVNEARSPRDDEVDSVSSLRLTKSIINAFCQANVVNPYKDNLCLSYL